MYRSAEPEISPLIFEPRADFRRIARPASRARTPTDGTRRRGCWRRVGRGRRTRLFHRRRSETGVVIGLRRRLSPLIGFRHIGILLRCVGMLRRAAAILEAVMQTIVQPQLAVNRQCTGLTQLRQLPSCSKVIGSRMLVRASLVTHFPNRDHHTHELMRKDFHSHPRLPPVVRIEIAVARGDYAQRRSRAEKLARRCTATGGCGNSK